VFDKRAAQTHDDARRTHTCMRARTHGTRVLRARVKVSPWHAHAHAWHAHAWHAHAGARMARGE